MNEQQQRIVESLMRLLLSQGGDCRACDYVDGDRTVADLLDEYEACAVNGHTKGKSHSTD